MTSRSTPTRPPDTVVLRHPSEALELVLPRGSLADLLMRLGYTEVEPEAANLPTYFTTQEKEDSDDQHDVTQ